MDAFLDGSGTDERDADDRPIIQERTEEVLEEWDPLTPAELTDHWEEAA